MIRQGDGEPLVLLHGVAATEAIWKHVVPLTAGRHDTVAITLLGHRGGPASKPGDDVTQVVDDAERQLDSLGLDRPHIAGNSLGGWVALELARRGRAASVCALAPAAPGMSPQATIN
jgi:pimeloyl-ACP methyl ester carboxylesterase